MAGKLTPAQTLAVWQAVRLNIPSYRRFIIGARKSTLDVLVRLGIAMADGSEHYLTPAGVRVKRTMTGPTDAPTLDKVAEYVTATSAPKEVTHMPTETPAMPTCEIFAGKGHDNTPPTAVCRVVLMWVTSNGVPMIRTKEICRSCLASKDAEFRENGGTVDVIRDYVAGTVFPNPEVLRSTWLDLIQEWQTTGRHHPYLSNALDRAVTRYCKERNMTLPDVHSREDMRAFVLRSQGHEFPLDMKTVPAVHESPRRVESSSQEPLTGVSYATRKVALWLENDSYLSVRAHNILAGKDDCRTLREFVEFILYDRSGHAIQGYGVDMNNLRSVRDSFTRGEFDMIDWDAVRDSLLAE